MGGVKYGLLKVWVLETWGVFWQNKSMGYLLFCSMKRLNMGFQFNHTHCLLEKQQFVYSIAK